MLTPALTSDHDKMDDVFLSFVLAFYEKKIYKMDIHLRKAQMFESEVCVFLCF